MNALKAIATTSRMYCRYLSQALSNTAVSAKPEVTPPIDSLQLACAQGRNEDGTSAGSEALVMGPHSLPFGPRTPRVTVDVHSIMPLYAHSRVLARATPTAAMSCPVLQSHVLGCQVLPGRYVMGLLPRSAWHNEGP